MLANWNQTNIESTISQESYFHWCFGVLEPDYFGAIDVATGKSVLYQPRLDEDYAIIMGHIPSPGETRERYRVDEVETRLGNIVLT